VHFNNILQKIIKSLDIHYKGLYNGVTVYRSLYRITKQEVIGMEHKKIYNGFLAYLYTDGITVMICFAVFGAAMLFASSGKIFGLQIMEATGGSVPFSERLKPGLICFGIALFGWLISLPAYLRIKKYSAPGTVGKHLLECYWNGMKIAFKISLCLFALFLPGLVKWSIGYPVTGVDKNGNEIWLKPIGNDVYEDPHGDRYTLKF
jgi:hypothetical protein